MLKIKIFCPTLGKKDEFLEDLLYYVPNYCKVCRRKIGDLDYDCKCKIISITPIRDKKSDEEILELINHFLKGGGEVGNRCS